MHVGRAISYAACSHDDEAVRAYFSFVLSLHLRPSRLFYRCTQAPKRLTYCSMFCFEATRGPQKKDMERLLYRYTWAPQKVSWRRPYRYTHSLGPKGVNLRRIRVDRIQGMS